jgi:hypothetical protein
MATYNSLSWQNENAFSSYPLSEDIEVQNFVVDAKFVQFDNFVPVLNNIYVESDRIELAITFDYGIDTAISFYKSRYLQGPVYRNIRIYEPVTKRHLGVIVFGEGVDTLWSSFVGRRITFNIPFAVETVRSIPLNDSVYTLDSSFGDITLGKTDTDKAVFYNTSTSLNSITLNAVSGNSIDPGQLKEGLRKINLVLPLDNNINLAPNDVVKITPVNNASLNVSLVSGSTNTAFSIPTLIA